MPTEIKTESGRKMMAELTEWFDANAHIYNEVKSRGSRHTNYLPGYRPVGLYPFEHAHIYTVWAGFTTDGLYDGEYYRVQKVLEYFTPLPLMLDYSGVGHLMPVTGPDEVWPEDYQPRLENNADRVTPITDFFMPISHTRQVGRYSVGVEVNWWAKIAGYPVHFTALALNQYMPWRGLFSVHDDWREHFGRPNKDSYIGIQAEYGSYRPIVYKDRPSAKGSQNYYTAAETMVFFRRDGDYAPTLLEFLADLQEKQHAV